MGGALVGNGDGGHAGRQEERIALGRWTDAETLTSPTTPILRFLDEPRYLEPSVSGAGKEAVPTDRAVGTVHRALGFISPRPPMARMLMRLEINRP